MTGVREDSFGFDPDVPVNKQTNVNDHKPLPVPNYYWKVLLKVKRDGEDITAAQALIRAIHHRILMLGLRHAGCKQDRYDKNQ